MNGGAGGETGGSRRKINDDESRIPVPNPRVFRRSASLRLRGERCSPRPFPETLGGQSCAKISPGRPPCRYRSQVTWVAWFTIPSHASSLRPTRRSQGTVDSSGSLGALGRCSTPAPRTVKNMLDALLLLIGTKGTWDSVVDGAPCYKPEDRGFETRWGEWLCFSIYLIPPAALGSAVHSASNRNEYQK
jgi:hypothetical protein